MSLAPSSPSAKRNLSLLDINGLIFASGAVRGSRMEHIVSIFCFELGKAEADTLPMRMVSMHQP